MNQENAVIAVVVGTCFIFATSTIKSCHLEDTAIYADAGCRMVFLKGVEGGHWDCSNNQPEAINNRKNDD